jgi:hypothetical protein
MKLAHVSASQIKTFRACASRWHWEKVGNFTTPPTPAMLRGTRIHALLENYLVHGTPIPPGDEGDIARTALPLLPGPGTVARENAEHVFNLGAGVLGVPARGVVDFIPQPGELVDFKTSSDPKRYGLALEELQQDPQAQLYALQAYAGRPVSFKHLYLKTGKPYGAHFGPEVTFDDGAVVEGARSLADTVAKMVTTAAAPVESAPYDLSRCGDYGGCPHRGRCASIGRPTAGGMSALFSAIQQETAPMSANLMDLLNAHNAAAAPVPPPTPPAPLSAPAVPPPAPATLAVSFTYGDAASQVIVSDSDAAAAAFELFERTFAHANGNQYIAAVALDTLDAEIFKHGLPIEVAVTGPGDDLRHVTYLNRKNPRKWRLASALVKLGGAVTTADAINPPDARPLAEMPTEPETATATQTKPAKASNPARALRLPGVDGGDGEELLLTRASKGQLEDFAASVGLDVQPVGNRSKPGAKEYREAITDYLVNGEPEPAAELGDPGELVGVLTVEDAPAPLAPPAAPLPLPSQPLPAPNIESAEVAAAVQAAEIVAALTPPVAVVAPETPTIARVNSATGQHFPERATSRLSVDGVDTMFIAGRKSGKTRATSEYLGLEDDGFILYVGCVPRGPYTALEDVLAPLAKEVAADAGVSYYLLIPFNEGVKRVASLLAQRIRNGELTLTGAVVVDPRQPASDNAVEVLSPLASDLVRRF